MTIAAGFHCNEGIVLCADTQETISGYIKGYDGKIITSIFHDSVVSIAGSGSSDYIQTAKQKAVVGLDGIKDFPAIKKKLESNLIEVFDNHLGRWAHFAESERPVVELLIAVSMVAGGFGLFHWSGTSFHQTHSKAIGAGILLANTLIQEYGIGNHTLKELSSLAIFILAKVKKNVDTCGGSTHMVIMKKGGDFSYPDDKQLEKVESRAEELEIQSRKRLKKQILARQLPDFAWFRSFSGPVTHDLAKDSKLGKK